MKTIYLSPERRAAPHGKFWGQSIYESDYCCELALLLKTELERHGFAVIIAPSQQNIRERAAWANGNSIDLYLPLHTNASTDGSREGNASGCEMLCQTREESRKVCRLIYNELCRLYPSDRGLRDGSAYIENNSVHTVTAYTEIAFHDNGRDAEFLAENKQQIAAAICRGVCEYFGVQYQPAQQKPNPDSSTIRIEELAKLLKDTYGIQNVQL